MITIKASIDIGENGTFDNSSSGIPAEKIVNVSSFLSVLGQSNPQKLSDLKGNGFTLGKSRLGSGAKYVKEIPYVVGRWLSDINGSFPYAYNITINSIGNMNAITLVFDEENGAHPQSITVNDNTVYDDDPRFEIPLNEPTDSIEITISNWSKPNSPFILSGIYAIGDFEISSENLLSFNSDILDRSNVEYPAYGLLTNSANLTFVDFNREAFELITKRILIADKDVTVWVDNTTEDINEQICKMKIQSITYNNDNLQVNMQLKDNLESMQNINVKAINYDPSNPHSETAKWYYEQLYEKTVEAAFDILTFNELDTATQNVLNGTTINYPLLDSDTLWNEWDKICALCLCHMYVDNNNRIVLKYSSGS